MTKTSLAVLTAVLAAAAAGAMEISLEENRGQRGSVGTVDLQAVFRRFPEVSRAKQSYAEVVRQAEEQVNLKKAELLRLRADVASLKAEREAAARAPLVVPQPIPAPVPAPVPAPTPAPAPEPAPAAPPKAAAAPADPALSSLPGMASTEPLRIAIPGLPEETLTPAADASAAAPAAPAALPEAPPPAAATAPAAPAAPSAAEQQAAAEEQLRRRDAKVKELDAAVLAKEAELAAKQTELASYQSRVEKDLLDIESKRSELLLGRIYSAVRDVAVENGVSVVIDKTAVLFGQASADLTDKVLKKLEGLAP